ncbi:MAG: hypothetical protein ISP71_02230 [Flavobacteriales bacterium]|nr:hypothetical protein [Flavobacteriales bacterium]
MKWIKIISQFLFVGGIIFLLAFTNTRYSNKTCTDYRINLADENTSLITRGEIILLMESIQDSIVGTTITEVPIYEIERKIESLNNVQNAEVYINMEGMLHIDVFQKKAIVRISPKEGKDFYMDSEGSIFGLSHNYTEHLLVANGNIQDSTDYMTVLDLAKYIYSDSLWNAQIVQIYLKENKEIELVPRVGNHTILLGDITNFQEKLKKLYLFYEKGVNQVGWNNYKEINLKFRNQIVCVKR